MAQVWQAPQHYRWASERGLTRAQMPSIGGHERAAEAVQPPLTSHALHVAQSLRRRRKPRPKHRDARSRNLSALPADNPMLADMPVSTESKNGCLVALSMWSNHRGVELQE